MRRSNKVDLSPLPLKSKRCSDAARAIEFAETYCILPDRRELITLHPYQRDLFEQWSDPTTKAHVTVIGAGNAKTSTLAAFVTAHLFLTDEADVPVVAATVRQAWYTTAGVAKAYVELHPDLLARAEVLEGQGSRSGIYTPGTRGHLYPIADNPSGLQGINPSIAVLEEMSEATMLTFGSLMNRLGKRATSKVIGISTPSFTTDNALIQVQRSFHSGNPMPGVVLLEYISEQKDYKDEAGWRFANPGLVTVPPVLDIEALRTDLALLPEQQFRSYRLCQNPTGSKSCWLNSLDDEDNEKGDSYDIWKKGEDAYQFTAGAVTVVGVDASKSGDHTAVVYGQMRPDGRWHFKCRIWTPVATGVIDLEEVASFLRGLCQTYDVTGIQYDPSYFYNAPALFYDGLPMIECPPVDQRTSPLCLNAYQKIRALQITHDEDDAFTRHVMAAKRRYNKHGFNLEKIRYEKIDAAIALVLAIGLAMPAPVQPAIDYATVKF